MDLEAHIKAVYEATHAPLVRVYPDQEPFHYGVLISHRLGGPDPLDGVSIYLHPGPPAHWHYVGLGLTELDEKQAPNKDISGWGFEPTFRLAIPPAVAALGTKRMEGFGTNIFEATSAAPKWPVVLLNELARYVLHTRRGFAHGHYLEMRAPSDPAKTLRYLGFVRDPALGATTTPNGTFHWLQAVGLTAAEFEELKGDAYEAFLARLTKTNPWGITTLEGT